MQILNRIPKKMRAYHEQRMQTSPVDKVKLGQDY